MNKYRSVILMLLGILSSSCSDSDGNSNHGSEEALYEAVFEYQIANQDYDRDVLFLELDGEDPTEEMLSNFENHIPPVKPVSLSTIIPDEENPSCGYVADAETDVPGIVFEVSTEITWNSVESAQVWGGWRMACLGAEWGTYHLELHDGEWRVTQFVAEIAA